jgi:hypothetical protein
LLLLQLLLLCTTSTSRRLGVLLNGLVTNIRLYLVREKKIFGCHIRYFIGCQKGFSDANKKTNYIAHLKTARRI